MRALVNTRYGSPDVLQIKEVPKPVPTDNEVLVKIRATTVNRTDYGILTAKPFIARFFYGLTKPKITILGNEFAGVIDAVGDDVTSFAVGEKVFGYDDAAFGAHAQYKAVSEAALLATMPANTSYEEAAPGNEGVHYALSILRRADIQEGDRVVIYGATGAIGTAAVQLAKYYGAEITAVCDTENIELVKSLGADKVIDYTEDDFPNRDFTYEVVIDAVGKTSYSKWKPVLAPRGLYLTTDLGPFLKIPLLVVWTRVVGSKRVLLPLPSHSKQDVVFFKELIESGDFRPVIDRRYPFEQIVEAYRYVATGQKIGNVVITVEHE
ncbi:MAG: NAD(P)-dependent alcohol dehydrogenase [Acidimicrobiia bacterium]